jgi:hypothetical protein
MLKTKMQNKVMGIPASRGLSPPQEAKGLRPLPGKTILGIRYAEYLSDALLIEHTESDDKAILAVGVFPEVRVFIFIIPFHAHKKIVLNVITQPKPYPDDLVLSVLPYRSRRFY